MRYGALFIATALLVRASQQPSTDSWLKLVAPLLSDAERSRYRSLPEAARQSFEEHFWDDKSIRFADYLARVTYVDANFGTGKAGSGANTDEGRVYLGLGAPNRVTRLVSSRTFVPLEIWYYSNAPATGTGSELRFLFYRRNSVGVPHLYSPTLDTIRALITPQPGTVGLFGPNETVDLNTLQSRLSAQPVENEILEAAVAVAAGVKGEENETILLRAMSPAALLRKNAPYPEVHSRLLARGSSLETLQTTSSFGGVQIDWHATVNAAQSIKLEIRDSKGVLYRNTVALHFDRARETEYEHRFDLLPGDYTLVLTVDGASTPYPLRAAVNSIGDIRRVRSASAERKTPWTFEGRHCELDATGRTVLLAAPRGSRVSWVIREGNLAVWKRETIANEAALLDLPSLPSGRYRLEASVDGESRVLPLDTTEHDEKTDSQQTLLSYNANLDPASRLSFLGRQALRRNDLPAATAFYEGSGNLESSIGLSQIDAMRGQLDRARTQLRAVLRTEPANYDALLAMAYVESRFQDFPAAEDFYRRALAVNPDR